MVQIVVAVAVWGKKLLGQSVLVRSDNMAVVAALRTGPVVDAFDTLPTFFLGTLSTKSTGVPYSWEP